MTASTGVEKARKRVKVMKDPWTAEQDRQLNVLVSTSGLRSWTKIARCLEGRTGKQCRERWLNYLDPRIKHDAWTHEEDMLLIQLQKKYRNRWATISKFMDGRTDNAIKNRWNSALKRIVEKVNNQSATNPMMVNDQSATSPMTPIDSPVSSDCGDENLTHSSESSLASVADARTSRKMSEIELVFADTLNFGQFQVSGKVQEDVAVSRTGDKAFWGVVPEHAYSSHFLDNVLEQCVDSSTCSEMELSSTWAENLLNSKQDELNWRSLF